MRFLSVVARLLRFPIAFCCVLPFPATAQIASTIPTHNVVLVHGAWADGSSWSKVIPLLEKSGLHVVCVQNPLTSFAEDVAATQRIIDAQDGPVLLVGHSYGGAVITEAGNNPKVVGLLYVASISGTHTDWTVKLIDVYPNCVPEKPLMSGYELAICMDICVGGIATTHYAHQRLHQVDQLSIV